MPKQWAKLDWAYQPARAGQCPSEPLMTKIALGAAREDHGRPRPRASIRGAQTARRLTLLDQSPEGEATKGQPNKISSYVRFFIQNVHNVSKEYFFQRRRISPSLD